MNPQHTPGPWALDTCWNGWMLLANGRVITAEPFDCEHADARLIAAAPDLLAAAQRMAAQIEGGNDFAKWEAAKADLLAAIAKATGEETNA